MGQQMGLATRAVGSGWLLTLIVFGLVTRPANLLGQARFEITLFGGVSTFLGSDPTGSTFAVPDRRLFDNAPGGDEPFLKTSYALGLAGRVRLGPRWGVEGSAVWMPTDVCHLECGGGNDLIISAYMLSGLYHLPSLAGHLEPFIALGAGTKLYDTHENVLTIAWSVGGGVTAAIADGVDLRFEARNYMSLPDAADFNPRASPNPRDRRFQNDLALTVGFAFYKPRAREGTQVGKI